MTLAVVVAVVIRGSDGGFYPVPLLYYSQMDVSAALADAVASAAASAGIVAGVLPLLCCYCWRTPPCSPNERGWGRPQSYCCI